MDYKKMIIEMLDKVQSQHTLRRVYRLLEFLYIRSIDVKESRVVLPGYSCIWRKGKYGK